MDAAAAVGAEVVVGSNREQALSGAMGDRAVVVDLDDPATSADTVEALHHRTPIDGIVAVDDQGVVAAAMAAERLGLAHNPPAAVMATRNKATMRQLLRAAGVPQPHFAVVGPDDPPGPLGYPAVLKPLEGSGSRGVIRVDNEDADRRAAERIRTMLGPGDPHHPWLLAESFVPGAEVAVEGLLSEGLLEVLAVFDKPDPLEGPYFEETIYVTPSRHPASVIEEVGTVTARACEAIGLVEGPVHAELRLAHDDGQGGRAEGVVPTVIEIAARSIGGLCSRTLRFGAGISLEEVVVRHALHLPVRDLERQDGASGVMMLPIPGTGRLREVRGVDAAQAVRGITDVVITIPVGRPVVALPEGDRYLGFAFARGATPEEVEASLRLAHARLDIVIDP